MMAFTEFLEFLKEELLKIKSRGTTWDGFSSQFFRTLEIKSFCFVVAIFDLVQDVEAIFLIP